MRQFGLLLSVSIVVGFASPVHSGEKLNVQAALDQRIIDPGLPLAEVQKFTESRIPPMPECKTIAEWEQHANRMRRDTLDRVVFRGKAAKWRKLKTKVEWLGTIKGGDGYSIQKLRYEAVPGIWIPALLYVPDKLTGKVPAILNVNGHDRANGKAAKYKQIRCINQAKRGMLALNVEWVGMGQLNSSNFSHYRMNQLNLCGTSGLAPFYLSMSRGLDILLAHENADSKRVGVAGLSGGGWQTIFISSLDTRVTLCDPVAGYSSFRTRSRNFSDLGDSEQTPCDMATVTDYAQMTAMLAPRPSLLTFNANDNCCFKAAHALPPLLEAARPIFALYGKTAYLRSHVNQDPGTHNFERDNREALYRMLGEFFFADSQDFDPKEIACDDEVKTKDELHVDLPKDNGDFHTVALSLIEDLPNSGGPPEKEDATRKWRQQRRSVLKELVAAKAYDVKAEKVSEAKFDNGTTASWRLKLGNDWTVPVVELVRGDAKATVIVVADGGRKSAAEEVERLLQAGNRVLAVDPFYFGESIIASRDFLFALMVSTVGERPLGLQASQLAAVALWSRTQFKTESVQIVAKGPRSSLFTLVAAAIEEQAIGDVTLHGAFASLKDIITDNMTVNTTPELFCFGLL